MTLQEMRQPTTAVERLTEFGGPDLDDLCDAAEAAIEADGGFGWLSPPPREIMESYWRGVLLVPQRELFVARLDGTVGGSAQLTLPARNNESQAKTGSINSVFMAPWARGYGLARMLMCAIEEAAIEHGLDVLYLDVRESQVRAIELYESLGYVQWGTNPYYAQVEGRWLAGHFFHKLLQPNGGSQGS